MEMLFQDHLDALWKLSLRNGTLVNYIKLVLCPVRQKELYFCWKKKVFKWLKIIDK